MPSIRHTLVLLALFGLAATPALADEMVSIKAGYQLLTPEGTFAVGSSSLAGTPVDLEKDLGFDDSKDVTAEVALQLGDFRLAVGYLPIQFSGNGQLTGTVNFNGKTYSGGVQTASDVDIKLYDVSLGYHLFNFDDTPVRFQLTPELSVKVVDAALSMDGQENITLTPIHEEDSVTAPIPTLGVRTRIGLADFLAVIGRVGYMEYNDNSFLDADAQVEFSPIPMVGLYGGYRYFDLQVDDSDILIDAQFSGPYVGAFVRF
ncbi:hypothetical protein JCM30471_16730 [Desulfuromonas carbonis]|uniref:hypothetical protein n=1 Tax=Desulfuromonas sp. DDH964 TaxID=1823759 RepID=UPI00078B6CD3|nr:hypothetical protein [Desulfuromonas sp. DDH964]AMV73271.1 hypothetical protein DBW_2962 [Desulfuromonas sp. DDH964]